MRSRVIVAVSTGWLIVSGFVVGSVQASGDQGLPGSNFELEGDANLRGDAGAPRFDWVSVAPGSTVGSERRQQDRPTGSGDDAFGRGAVENSAVPTVVDGSIPANESDLLSFGGVQEGMSGDGFLHLFWTRLRDPKGPTTVDFEFNRNKCQIVDGAPTADSVCSGNRVTPVRTAGVDLLITYEVPSGATDAVLGKRTWLGPAWGPYTQFSDSTARGTINTTAIPAWESDGLGLLSGRTFGEASFRLSSVLPTGATSCTSLRSAHVKTRSATAFTAAVADFIAPLTIDITNCGTVTIINAEDAGNAGPSHLLAGAVFTLHQDSAPLRTEEEPEDTATAFTCTTAGDGTCSMTGVPFGSYWVVETITPPGHDTAPSQPTAVSPDTPGVTLNFVNHLRVGTLTVVKDHINNNEGSAPSVRFSFTRNGADAVTFDADSINGPYTYPAGTVIDVVESTHSPNHATTYTDNDSTTSSACIDVVIPNSANVTCTIRFTSDPGPGLRADLRLRCAHLATADLEHDSACSSARTPAGPGEGHGAADTPRQHDDREDTPEPWTSSGWAHTWIDLTPMPSATQD